MAGHSEQFAALRTGCAKHRAMTEGRIVRGAQDDKFSEVVTFVVRLFFNAS